MTDDAFGFSASRRSLADRVRTIAPDNKPLVEERASVERVDAAGAALGFVSRDSAASQPRRRRKEVGPTIPINMRIPEALGERFIAFCETERMSYWEGVEELMRRAKV